MIKNQKIKSTFFRNCIVAVAALLICGPLFAAATDDDDDNDTGKDCSLRWTFIPVDSWVYPAVMRLHSLGFVDSAFLGLRPWTRESLNNALEDVSRHLEDTPPGTNTEEAEKIYDALLHELNVVNGDPCKATAHVESSYSIVRGISGTPLRDSFHLGSTVINDYGRPYANGISNYSGMSGYATAGRFAVYVRGEFQGAPSSAGYSSSLYQKLAQIDVAINPVTGIAYPGQATIPLGPIDTAVQGRLLEAYVSAQVLNHVISFGKQDEWMGTASGGGMAFSNNAENFYAFHINRIEPLQIPLLSRLTGPFRYEFLVGALRGHTLMRNPNFTGDTSTQPNVLSAGNPWVHVEKVSFKPTPNLEFGFERTALFGGKGHSPVTLHTFLKSFFSTKAPVLSAKNGRDDDGARFGAFDFSYRLPYLRNWLTLYADSEVHDDMSPIDAPRRAAWRPGIYLARVPGIAKLDLRVEAAMSDPSISSSYGGRFMYYEYLERQGYTNQGQIFGDWIGREGKGGQAWLTYHLSGNEWVQASVRTHKTAKDFIPGGTTLTDVGLQVVKRIRPDMELNGNFSYERWKAPVYMPGTQTVTTTMVQFTWYPARKVSF